MLKLHTLVSSGSIMGVEAYDYFMTLESLRFMKMRLVQTWPASSFSSSVRGQSKVETLMLYPPKLESAFLERALAWMSNLKVLKFGLPINLEIPQDYATSAGVTTIPVFCPMRIKEILVPVRLSLQTLDLSDHPVHKWRLSHDCRLDLSMFEMLEDVTLPSGYLFVERPGRSKARKSSIAKVLPRSLKHLNVRISPWNGFLCLTLYV